jgi:hypothetical protein
MANMPSLSASIRFLPISKIVVSKVMEIQPSSLGPTRCCGAASGTAVDFFNDTAERRIHVTSVFRLHRID